MAPVFKHGSLKTTLCQLSKPQQVVQPMNETIQQADYMLQWIHLKKQLSYTYFSSTVWKISLIMGYQRKLHELFHLWESRSGSHSFFFHGFYFIHCGSGQSDRNLESSRHRGRILNNLIKISEKIEPELKKNE